MRLQTFALFLCTIGSIICLAPVGITMFEGIEIAPDRQQMVGIMIGVGIFLSIVNGSFAISMSAERDLFQKDDKGENKV